MHFEPFYLKFLNILCLIFIFSNQSNTLTLLPRQDPKLVKGSKSSFNEYKCDIKPKLIPSANFYLKDKYINHKKEVCVKFHFSNQN